MLDSSQVICTAKLYEPFYKERNSRFTAFPSVFTADINLTSLCKTALLCSRLLLYTLTTTTWDAA
jgi:hypothetical protein